MPEQLLRTTYVDDQPDDVDDGKLLGLAASPKPVFVPSHPSRFSNLQLMPPPTATSIVATRALSKEFKSLVKQQSEGKLPFYMDPGSDR